MRLSRIILSLVALVAMCATPLSAQSPVDMAVRISDDTATQLGENNTTLLRNKLSKIITRNGLADSEGFFALEPSIAIIDEGIADTGMAKIRVITAELTLAVKNIVDGTIFESQTIELKGNGNSDEACWRALINKLNINDARFAKMLDNARTSINDFYERHMPNLMRRIETLITSENYDEALAALTLIPDTVDQYAEVCAKKIEVYNRILEVETRRIIASADNFIRQGRIDDALEACRNANVLSPNYDDVVSFLKRLDAEAAAAEAAYLEQQQREADAAKSSEKMVESANCKAETIKNEIVNSYQEKEKEEKKSRKSLGQILFGL